MTAEVPEVSYRSVPDGLYFYGLVVVVGRTHRLLMWNDLLGAEGTDTEVKFTFRLHDLTVRGSGLLKLFRDAKRHKIDLLTITPRHQQMQGGEGMIVTAIEVKAVE